MGKKERKERPIGRGKGGEGENGGGWAVATPDLLLLTGEGPGQCQNPWK